MKRLFTVLMTLLMVIGLSACISSREVPAEPETAENEADEETVQEEEKVLVVYFSATGNTREVAQKIASIAGADIYEIKALEEYTEDDLSYNSSTSRTTNEQNDPDARPAIG
ncbi:MAG: flavodoxin, partial [Erysipelotrichaceae bacterium]|nr:flavodoxin [Erysipelotrichaceae bacterium]